MSDRVAACALLLIACRPPSPPAGPPSVVLITLDTTRADAFSAYGHPWETTPRFDALAGDGALYERAIASASVTPVSHASILTGRYPHSHGLRVLSAASGYRLPGDVPGLANTLAAAGYDTAAVHSAFPVSAHFGLDAGFATFDSFDVAMDVSGDAHTWDVSAYQRRSDETADRVLGLIDQLEPPFFLWVHFWDPHDIERLPPAPFFWRLPVEIADLGKASRDRYAAEVAYVDAQYGRIEDALRRRGLYENTAIAVTADHGEGLGEHGWLTHRLLYDEQLHVPLILRLPEGPRGLRVAEQVRTVDLAPSLLAAVDAPALPALEGVEIDGAILPGLPGGASGARPAYADQLNGYDLNAGRVRALRPADDLLYSLSDGAWKLIYRPTRPAESELFHLPTDPDEATNRLAQDPAPARRLLLSLARMAPWRTAPFEGSGEDADAQAMLAALGYQEAPDDAGPSDWVWTCAVHPAVSEGAPGPCPRCAAPTLPRAPDAP